jgi:hypothetical protein
MNNGLSIISEDKEDDAVLKDSYETSSKKNKEEREREIKRMSKVRENKKFENVFDKNFMKKSQKSSDCVPRMSIATEGGVFKIQDLSKAVKTDDTGIATNNIKKATKTKQREEKNSPQSPLKDKKKYNSSKEGNSAKNKFESVENDRLTLEQVVRDINKSYLSFNKRPSESGPVKGYLKMRNFLPTKKLSNYIEKNQLKPNSQLIIVNQPLLHELEPQNISNRTDSKLLAKEEQVSKNSSSHSPTIKPKFLHSFKKVTQGSKIKSLDKTIDAKGKFRYNRTIQEIISLKTGKIKFRNIYNVITTVLFLRREICKFGVKPRLGLFFQSEQVNSDRSLSIYSGRRTMRNLDHFLKNKNESKKVKIPWYLISPNSKFLIAWNFCIFSIMIYSVIIMPFRLSFTENFLNPASSIFPFDISVEVIFFLDILKTFFLPYYSKDGRIITNLSSIFLNYLNSWMILDILSIFPFYLIEYYTSELKANSGNSVFILFRLPKIYRLVRLVKVLKLANQINSQHIIQKLEVNFGISRGFLKLFSFFISVLVVCHIFACMWYFICKLQDYDPETWVVRYDLKDEDIFLIYLTSLYFAFTSFITVGYGDITAHTNLEIILIIFWLCTSGVYYSFSISNLSNIFSNYNARLIETNKKAMIITEIAKNNGFSKHLEDKLKTYNYKMTMKEDANNDYKLILAELPTGLKYKISNSIFSGKINKIPIVTNSNKDFIANIVPLLTYQFVPKKSAFYLFDDTPENVYFILQGDVYFLTEDKIVFLHVTEGSYFGEIEVIKKTYRDSSTMASSNCEVLIMTKSVLLDEVSKNHIDFFNEMVHHMIIRYNFQEKVKRTIEKVIEEGIKIYFSSHEYNPNKEMTNKDFFDLGIKVRMEQKEDEENLDFIDDFVDSEEIHNEIILNRFKERRNYSSSSKTIKTFELKKTSFNEIKPIKSVKAISNKSLNENFTIARQGSLEILNNIKQINITESKQENYKVFLLNEIENLKKGNKYLSEKMDKILKSLNNLENEKLNHDHKKKRLSLIPVSDKTKLTKHNTEVGFKKPSLNSFHLYSDFNRVQSSGKLLETRKKTYISESDDESFQDIKIDNNLLIGELCKMNKNY